MSTLETLRARAGLKPLNAQELDEFLEKIGEGHALLFFSGAPPRPETFDVAMVLPEILKNFEGRLTGALVAPEAENAVKSKFQVYVAPSLCVTRGGKPVAVLPKILDWAEYLQKINAALAPDAPILEEPKKPATTFTFSGEAAR